MKPKFYSGDKVFAKVRGYPPWPARVKGLADETPNKMRYHVSFYGTGETAIVKAEDLFAYVENKARLGKPKKHKNFAGAINELEEDLSSQEALKLTESESNDKSFLSDNDKSKTSLSPMKPKERKRKNENDSGSEDHDQKKRASTLSNSDNESNASKTAEFLSRSGRKIKPKRFADFDEEGTGDDNILSVANETPPARATAKVPPHSRTTECVSPNENFIVACVDNEKLNIPLSLNVPTFSDPKALQEWKRKVANYALFLKKRLEKGEKLKESIEEHMEKWTTEHHPNKHNKSEEEFIARSEHLRTEALLLEYDLSIKTALNIKGADIKRSISLLSKLAELKLTHLMLKKHPEVVQTIKKVRRYIGNVPRALTADEEEAFHKDTETIRNKADHIYRKFQSLFIVGEGRTFWDVFEEARLSFDRCTKHMTTEEIVSLIKDPTE